PPFFFFISYLHHRDLRSFPTRRSSDLLQASLEKVNRVLLRNHLETCVSEAIRTGQGQEKIAELMEALPYNSGLTDFRHRAEPLRSEEHTSELQSRGHLVCRLLLEKKKK